ncbi:MAG: Na+/H+ antiporter NhaC family protein [Bacteroidales bacterium]|nr:Na+/H+ antiporter NhaC family protein [Bacteroidales bacterium]
MKTRLIFFSPVVFLAVYLGGALLFGDFARVPVSVAFLSSVIYGFAVAGGSVRERLKAFAKGTVDRNILMIIAIFMLAGAFSETAKGMGAIEATVNLILNQAPANMVLLGLFMASCIVSMALGTSIGTIVSLAPIAGGIAQQGGGSIAFVAAVIVGGALFGDNLSFISDTTIAATRLLGCNMRDKFFANLRIVTPAFVVVVAIYLIVGICSHPIDIADRPVELIRAIPYFLLLLLAFCGLRVMQLLPVGIISAAVIGLATKSFSGVECLGMMGKGTLNMWEISVITMMAGGLMGLIRSGGGFEAAIESLTSRVKGARGGEFSIAAMVCAVDLCTANNTISILTTGGIAREISAKFNIDPRRTASLLDTFSCFMQGLLPYGSQILIAAQLVGCAPFELVPYLYYPYLIGISALLSIVFRREKR